jgi:hypothetical protein
VTYLDLAAALPGIAALRGRSRAIAALEEVVDPGGQYHRYGFGGEPGAEWAVMDNGGGDSYRIAFSGAGAFLAGFDHEAPVSPAANDDELWPGLIDAVPAEFAGHLTDPAFCYEDVFEATVCLWRRTGDDRWQHGDLELPDHRDPDGANWLFQVLLDPTPATYTDSAQAYYGRELDPAVVAETWIRFA